MALMQRVHYAVHLIMLCLLIGVVQYKMPHSSSAHQAAGQQLQMPVHLPRYVPDQQKEEPQSTCPTCPTCRNLDSSNGIFINGSDPTSVPRSVGIVLAENDTETLMMLINQAPVRNADKFQLEKDFVPLILRVHREELFLFQTTLRFYSEIKDIHRTILVISFDALYPELITEAMKITFCQVKILLAPSGHWMLNRVPGPEV